MFPSIADGRDLVYDLIGKNEWSPIITLKEVVEWTPAFVTSLLTNQRNALRGRFYLGQLYSLNYWKAFPDCCTFVVT